MVIGEAIHVQQRQGKHVLVYMHAQVALLCLVWIVASPSAIPTPSPP
jgi:hypothetical protein